MCAACKLDFMRHEFKLQQPDHMFAPSAVFMWWNITFARTFGMEILLDDEQCTEVEAMCSQGRLFIAVCSIVSKSMYTRISFSHLYYAWAFSWLMVDAAWQLCCCLLLYIIWQIMLVLSSNICHNFRNSVISLDTAAHYCSNTILL